MADASSEGTDKNDTKEALVTRQSQDAVSAVSSMMREHQKAVFSLAYARLRNAHDAEDVTQDVFVEAFRQIRKLKDARHVLPWLFRVTSCRCKDHVRKVIRREKREADFAWMRSLNPLDDPTLEEQRRDALVKAVDGLPEKFRVVVMLKHFARLSYDDISKMTGLSKTTIDGRLRTAKKRLRKTLSAIGEEAD
ncbi:MAG: RNA polymerase sigma factor [Candidatus Abyssobacteria bacterium SURF_17]|uniref:RNA polymerase sigma factor n=1 Tax=Candidatus Abyssobacteria bacterium SURF_17 TaxID=2093361 RepID=A0A419EUS6_9BACT|nr:MAG: RNA polymerase sigma factor [Candidatus Abyssubacteria bacterium SURF_17]